MKADSIESPDMRAHRLAEEAVRRIGHGHKTLGSPSLYNTIRELLIEEFSEEFDKPAERV